MDLNEIRQAITALCEPEYRAFSQTLLPDVPDILGVRLPKLRQLAKELTKTDHRWFLAMKEAASFEEVMLRGFLIGMSNLPNDRLFAYIANFIPQITNWSVCDSFCACLKQANRQPEVFWEFISPYCMDEREFFARFGTVMMLHYFIDKVYIHKVLIRLTQVQQKDYYAMMGVAWALAECYIKFPEETLPFLQNENFPALTRKKALTKICDSYRVTQEDKALLKEIRRSIV